MDINGLTKWVERIQNRIIKNENETRKEIDEIRDIAMGNGIDERLDDLEERMSLYKTEIDRLDLVITHLSKKEPKSFWQRLFR